MSWCKARSSRVSDYPNIMFALLGSPKSIEVMSLRWRRQASISSADQVLANLMFVCGMAA